MLTALYSLYPNQLMSSVTRHTERKTTVATNSVPQAEALCSRFEASAARANVVKLAMTRGHHDVAKNLCLSLGFLNAER